jgi:hypothetical protein
VLLPFDLLLAAGGTGEDGRVIQEKKFTGVRPKVACTTNPLSALFACHSTEAFCVVMVSVILASLSRLVSCDNWIAPSTHLNILNCLLRSDIDPQINLTRTMWYSKLLNGMTRSYLRTVKLDGIHDLWTCRYFGSKDAAFQYL